MSAAVHLARSGVDLDSYDYTPLIGCALPDFKPVVTTIPVVAKFLRYQCQCINGDWDWREYENLLPIFRSQVTVVPEQRIEVGEPVWMLEGQRRIGGAITQKFLGHNPIKDQEETICVILWYDGTKSHHTLSEFVCNGGWIIGVIE